MEKVTFVYGGFGNALYINGLLVTQGTRINIHTVVHFVGGDVIVLTSFEYDLGWFYDNCVDGKFPKLLKDVKERE